MACGFFCGFGIQQVQAAMTAVETAAATQAEKAEMLMEIAMGLQQKPERAEDIFAAVDLYKLAMDLAPEGEVLGVARIRARMATALMAVPAEDATQLKEAKIEIETALATLTAEGIAARVVSVPCFELFEAQSDDYKANIIGTSPVKIAVEAGIRMGWDRFIGIDGAFIGMSGFGASAPYQVLYEHFGITSDAVVAAAKGKLAAA